MRITIDNDVLGTAILKGDADSFKLFFKKHHKNLLGFTTTLTKDMDQAEDIVQLAFITLWKERKTLNDPNGLKQYLYTTAKNLFIDRLRSTKSRVDLYAGLTYEAVHIDSEDNDEYVQERIKKLHKAIDGLPARCQEILKLNKLEGLRQDEVADYLGISLRTVEAQMRIAYQKIREAFDDGHLLMFLIARIRL
jgi:RNA polymerase sigma-70 factor (ECF subfamily)